MVFHSALQIKAGGAKAGAGAGGGRYPAAVAGTSILSSGTYSVGHIMTAIVTAGAAGTDYTIAAITITPSVGEAAILTPAVAVGVVGLITVTNVGRNIKAGQYALDINNTTTIDSVVYTVTGIDANASMGATVDITSSNPHLHANGSALEVTDSANDDVTDLVQWTERIGAGKYSAAPLQLYDAAWKYVKVDNATTVTSATAANAIESATLGLYVRRLSGYDGSYVTIQIGSGALVDETKVLKSNAIATATAATDVAGGLAIVDSMFATWASVKADAINKAGWWVGAYTGKTA